MLRFLVTWMRGLAVVRSAELVRDLGERRAHLERLSELRQQFPGVKLSNDIRLIGETTGRLFAESGSTVEAGTLLVFGDDLNGYGRIQVGAGTWIGQYNNLRASGNADVVIGKQCLISQFCTLVGTNHLKDRDKPIIAQGADPTRRGVILEDDVWLGAGVTILPGVRVGQGAIVAAGAVVSRDVPAYAIWSGVPAQRLGLRT
jgi:acetyltransferase-like isoleucine patch superfamily enzyme